MSGALHACTVVERGRLAFARVLARSWHEHHPDSEFTALVLDDGSRSLDRAAEPFTVLSPRDLELPGSDLPVARHWPAEQARPRLLRHLLSRGEAEMVVYLDPQVRVYGPLADLLGSDDSVAVLAVRATRPPPLDGRLPNQLEFVAAGPYNRGFVAMRRVEATKRLFAQATASHGVEDEPVFYDHPAWLDLLPVLVPTLVVEDPGFGVSYWNLHYREIAPGPDGYSVNGRPLAFFDFGGYSPDTPHHLSWVQNRTQLYRHPVVAELCDRYRAELLGAGYEDAGRRGSGRHRLGPTREHPISSASPALTAPLPPRQRSLGSRIVDLENLVADLRANGASPASVARQTARALNPLVRARPAGRGSRRLRPGSKPAGAELGVNVVGYLVGEVGIGEVARQACDALTSCGVPVQPIGVPARHSRNDHPYPAGVLADARFPVNLVCFNADMFPAWRRAAGESFFRNRVTIGLWQWEVDVFPERFRAAFADVDEVWVGSEHIARALRSSSDRTVTRITIPVVPYPAAPSWPATVDQPPGFTFLFVFDHLSVFERKNPLGLIWAFASAFPAGSGASLLIKTVNGEQRPADRALLLDEAERHPDVHIQDGYLPPAEKNALIAGCDCYVSLHRAEGLGLTMAEAMYFERPVIATGYSGNLDFMDAANSFLIDYSLTPIGPGSDPYPPEGQWAEPDLDHAARLMRGVYGDRDQARQLAARAAADIRRTHSHEAAGATMSGRLRQMVAAK